MNALGNKHENNSSCQKSRVVFFGSPLIDVTSRVDDAFLQNHKLKPDNTYWIDTAIFPEVGGSTQIGGSVTNTARVFRKMSPEHYSVTYFGSVGDDDYGRFIKRGLESEGLGADLREIHGQSTGKVGVLLCDKARTLVTDLGASQKFALDEDMWTKLNDACYIYLSAFFIGVSFKAVTQICEHLDAKIAINLGAPFLATKFPQELKYLYKNSSLVFGNEAEHRAFAQINDVTSNDLCDAVIATNQLHENESRVVVVTRGGGSVLVIDKGRCEEYEIEALNPEKIIDTNGAGDAFVGGFLARFVDGDSVANCVRCGIQVARQIIQIDGFNVDF